MSSHRVPIALWVHCNQLVISLKILGVMPKLENIMAFLSRLKNDVPPEIKLLD